MDNILEQARSVLDDLRKIEVEAFFEGSIAEMIISRYAEHESFPADQNMLDLLGVAADECQLEADAQSKDGRDYLLACTEVLQAIQADLQTELKTEEVKERTGQRELRRAQAEHKEEKTKAKRKWWKSF